MRSSPPALRHLKLLAMLVLALALWLSTVHGVMHHHHDDFETHGDCAICKVVGSSSTLPDIRHTGLISMPRLVSVTCPIPRAHPLPPRLMRLRAPSTSPPVSLV